MPACLALVLSAAVTPVASAAVQRADFNGDGFSDLAVGVPNEALGGDQRAGVVNVLYGSAKGLSKTASHEFTQSQAGGISEPFDLFGAALVAGDFNGDGRWDLAIGAPGEDYPSGEDAGAVNVLYGSKTGLVSKGAQEFTQAQVGGKLGTGDQFGAALTIGNFDGKAPVDLAVGAPNEDVNVTTRQGVVHYHDAGVVNVMFAGSAGLKPTGGKQYTQGSAGGRPGTGDRFGAELAGGNFNGSGASDLAVGAPTEDLPNGFKDAGVVNVMFAGAGGLTPVGAMQLEAEFGATHNQAGSRFGTTLAAGNFDAQGPADLAIGAPAKDLGAGPDAGQVSVFYNLVVGPKVWGAYNEVAAGGQMGKGNRFGAALAAGNFNASGAADLAIGTPSADNGAGAGDSGVVNVMYGIAATPGSVDGGFRVFGNAEFTQQDAGSAVEFNDQFGTAVASGNYNGVGADELAIGASRETLGSLGNAGLVNVMIGYSNGIGREGARPFTQKDAGGIVEAHDLFGGVMP